MPSEDQFRPEDFAQANAQHALDREKGPKPSRFQLMREWVLLTIEHKLRGKLQRENELQRRREKFPPVFGLPARDTPAIFRLDPTLIPFESRQKNDIAWNERLDVFNGLAIPMQFGVEQFIRIQSETEFTERPAVLLQQFIDYMTETVLELARQLPDRSLFRRDQHAISLLSRVIIDAIFVRMNKQSPTLADRSIKLMINWLSSGGTVNKLIWAGPEIAEHLINAYELDTLSDKRKQMIEWGKNEIRQTVESILQHVFRRVPAEAVQDEIQQAGITAGDVANLAEATALIHSLEAPVITSKQANALRNYQLRTLSEDLKYSLDLHEIPDYEFLEAQTAGFNWTEDQIVNLYELRNSSGILSETQQQTLTDLSIREQNVYIVPLNLRYRVQLLGDQHTDKQNELMGLQDTIKTINNQIEQTQTEDETLATLKSAREKLQKQLDQSLSEFESLNTRYSALVQFLMNLDDRLEKEQRTTILKEKIATIEETEAKRRRVHYRLLGLLENLKEGTWYYRILRDWRLKNSTQHAMYHGDTDVTDESLQKLQEARDSLRSSQELSEAWVQLQDNAEMQNSILAAADISVDYIEVLNQASIFVNRLYVQKYGEPVSAFTGKRKELSKRIDQLLAAVHRMSPDFFADEKNLELTFLLLIPYLDPNRINGTGNNPYTDAELVALARKHKLDKRSVLPAFMLRDGKSDVLTMDTDRKYTILVNGFPQIVTYYAHDQRAFVSKADCINHFAGLAQTAIQSESQWTVRKMVREDKESGKHFSDSQRDIIAYIFNDLSAQKNKNTIIQSKRLLRKFIKSKFDRGTFRGAAAGKLLEEMVVYIQETANTDFTVSIGSRSSDRYDNPANGFSTVGFGNGSCQFDVYYDSAGQMKVAKRAIHYSTDGADVDAHTKRFVDSALGGQLADNNLRHFYPTMRNRALAKSYNFAELTAAAGIDLVNRIQLIEFKPMETFHEAVWTSDEAKLFADPGNQRLLEEFIDLQIDGTLQKKRTELQQLVADQNYEALCEEGIKQFDVLQSFKRQAEISTTIAERWKKYLQEHPDFTTRSVLDQNLIQKDEADKVIAEITAKYEMTRMMKISELNRYAVLCQSLQYSLKKKDRDQHFYEKKRKKLQTEQDTFITEIFSFYKEYIKEGTLKRLVKEMRLGSMSTVVQASLGLLCWELAAGEMPSLLIPKSLGDADRLDNIPFSADHAFAESLANLFEKNSGLREIDPDSVFQDWAEFQRSCYKLSMIFQAQKELASHKMSIFSAITASTDKSREDGLKFWTKLVNKRVSAIALPPVLFSVLSGDRMSGFTTVFTEGVKSAIGGLILKKKDGSREFRLTFRELVSDKEYHDHVAPYYDRPEDVKQWARENFYLSKQDVVEQKVFWVDFVFVMSKLNKSLVDEAAWYWKERLGENNNEFFKKFPHFILFLHAFARQKLVNPSVTLVQLVQKPPESKLNQPLRLDFLREFASATS